MQMSKAGKKNSQINPEILCEREKERTKNFYDDEDFGFRLFPGFLDNNGVSATESTGLIQVTPVTPEILEVYDNVYSYRRREAETTGDSNRD